MSHLWAQGSGKSSSQAFRIQEKAGWMCVKRERGREELAIEDLWI